MRKVKTKDTGFGAIKGAEDITIENLFDEHGALNNENFSKLVNVGDKVEVVLEYFDQFTMSFPFCVITRVCHLL